jgi:peptidoglycan/LPS O-acetylase OafA/YrhL
MQAPFLGMGEGAPLESPARRIDRPQRSGPHPVVGYYRLALAVCVLFSHFGLFVGGYDQGQSAVIGFFLLSGYVMTLLLGKHYPKLWQAPGFYVDRLARIFPQYLVYVVATLAVLHVLPIANSWSAGCDGGMILGNLAIVPLYFQGPPWWTCTLIPQAWSLALELMFYLVVPLLAVRLWPVTALAAAYSFWVYGQAYLGIINTDWFGFRQLPGTLFIFIAGMAFARPGVGWIVYRWGVWVMSLVLWGVLLHVPHLYALGTNKEIVAGVAFGIPALAITRKLPSTPWDRLAGDLSYGVYLNHFLVVLLVQAGIGQAPSWPALLAVCAGSVGLSLSTFRTIELPILARRRAWRARRERASARAASEIARDPNLLDAES